jgi:hypothetical protein
MGAIGRKVSALDVDAHQRQGVSGRAWQQFTALNRKNITIRRRALMTNLLLIGQSAVFIGLIWGVDKAVRSSNQRRPAFAVLDAVEPEAIGPIPDCSTNKFLRQGGAACLTILYSPQGVPIVEQIMEAVAKDNTPPLPPEHLRSFPNASAVDAYLLKYPETALSAVNFNVDSPTSISFTLQTNSTSNWWKGEAYYFSP